MLDGMWDVSGDEPRAQGILAARVCPTCLATRLPLNRDSQLARRV